jgi:4-hydroxy-3-polyprenylbenzoate decarboxylase
VGENKSSYVVALTGASGAGYGLRLIRELLRRSAEVDVIASPTAMLIAEDELGLKMDVDDPATAILDYLAKEDKGELTGKLSFYPSDLITAPPASGSALRRDMIICPSSMGTLGRIASGVSTNLVDRAADCVLKERGTLVLVPRETPFNQIHLENMLRLSRAGAVILPAMPAFYSGPSSIDDLINFIVGKILDILGLQNDLYKRWNGEDDGKGNH